MQINEIFSSIDGEGIRTGYLTTFIRSQFCNLECSYCDTRYSWDACDNEGNKQFTVMSVEEIVQRCDELGNLRITFTGGEPLIQRDAPELVAALLDAGYEVNIETNGAVDLPTFEKKLVDILQNDEALNNLIYTLDYKCPSSGMEDRMILSNIPFLIKGDVLKFVVGTQEDLDHMKAIVDEYVPNPHTFEVFISPVWGSMDGETIVNYMKEHDMQNVRVQVQLHKIFWDVDMRGV